MWKAVELDDWIADLETEIQTHFFRLLSDYFNLMRYPACRPEIFSA